MTFFCGVVSGCVENFRYSWSTFYRLNAIPVAETVESCHRRERQ